MNKPKIMDKIKNKLALTKEALKMVGDTTKVIVETLLSSDKAAEYAQEINGESFEETKRKANEEFMQKYYKKSWELETTTPNT